MTTINLLGQALPLSIEPGAEGFVAMVQPVIQGAADLLTSQAPKLLTPTMTNYLGALRGFGVGAQRSFTACAGTADQADGEYVFYLGATDVVMNQDPLWWASCMIHDGGHAWLSQQARVAIGVAVEQDLSQTQIDYYDLVGTRPSYVADLEAYIADPAAIAARIAEAA